MNTLEQVHATLRPLVNAFLMKSRYPFTLEAGGRVQNVHDGEQWKTFSLRVNFFDPNFPQSSVGALKLATKTDGGLTFVVTGRKVVAPRRKGTDEKCSKSSTDEKKVLKLMRQMITPYTLAEISGFYTDRVGKALDPWKRELYSKTRAPYQQVTYETMVRELRNLKDLGINPITSEFRNMMEETLAYHDEYEYRNSVPVTKTFASIRESGVHTTTNGALVTYPTFDALPKDLQGKLAILKMLKDGDSIAEVGVRVDSQNFWLFSMPERVDAGNK